MNRKIHKIFVIIVMGISSLALGAASPYIYKIKIGEFPDKASAQARQLTLLQLDYGPLNIVQKDGKFELQYGEFPYFIDADLICQDLQKSGYKDAAIIKENNSTGKVDFSPIIGAAVERVFNTVEKNDHLTSVTLDMKNPEIVQMEAFMKTASTEQKHDALAAKLDSLSDSDPVKGWMMMRLAYMKLIMKDRGASQQLFQRIAEGKVAATPKLRLDAMNRVAHLIYAQNDFVRSYRAYREIYNFAEAPEQRVEVALELSGLMVDLAQNLKKGTLEEARAFHEAALDEMPEKNFNPRATIALLHAETWYYEKNYAKCMEESEAYLKKYMDKPLREIATCKLFLGLAYDKLNRYEEGKNILATILDMPLGPKDNWGAIPDIKLSALEWLIIIAKGAKNPADEAHWKSVKQMMYPNK
ncbi:MAG: SPOR domain-containing protein [Candidatus Sumerlaeota bacterium]|nr:SPOR domain-containing protein [Candidatus Sumerlaeota bacterium]